MKKSIKKTEVIFPMPVLMIATYDEEGNIDVMNAAWGTMCGRNNVMLKLTETHKTVDNIKKKGAFTVSLADSKHVTEADYVGIVSANNTPDKFEKSGLTAVKSENVDAPIINEFPVVMECKFIEYNSNYGVIGEVVNVMVEESFVDSEEKIDVKGIDAIMYDPFNHGYYKVGEKVGNAFEEGKKLK